MALQYEAYMATKSFTVISIHWHSSINVNYFSPSAFQLTRDKSRNPRLPCPSIPWSERGHDQNRLFDLGSCPPKRGWKSRCSPDSAALHPGYLSDNLMEIAICFSYFFMTDFQR